MNGVLLLSWLLAAPADAVADIEELDLAALLSDDDVTVSSSKAAGLRASPGVVTVWDREQIRQLGVRDLSELLPFVAGFDLGIDTVGIVGPAFRGVWGFEGKVLVLVDGMELNETSFGTVPLYARIPLEDIERVEVLRGPGSARYGGFAELAVISVTTRSATPKDRFSVESTTGVTNTERAPRNGTAAIMGGLTLPSLGDVDASGFLQITTREQSQRDYTDLFGSGTISQADRSDVLNLWLQSTVRAPFFEGRLLLQNWQQVGQTGYDSLLERPGPAQFLTGVLDLRAPLPLSPSLSLLPRITLTRDAPWRTPVDDPEYRLVNDRARAGLTSLWTVFPGLSLSGGVEATGDLGREPTSEPRDADIVILTFDDPTDDRFGSVALFGEAVIDTPLFTLTTGARGEQHTAWGGSFVARVALTRVFDGAHAKLLVAGAFRAPAIDNLRANADLRPERTGVLEAEAGVALGRGLYLTVNAFDLTVTDPIAYFVDVDDNDGYANFGRTGSRGVEATLLGASSIGRIEASWSYATTAGKNDVDLYAVPGDADRVLGIPAHKIALVGSLFLSPDVTLTANAVVRSERAVVVGFDDDGEPRIGELPASTLVGGTLRWVIPGAGLEAHLGVRNLLGEDFRLAQPYASGHAPLPIDDREVFVRLCGSLDVVD